MALVKSFPEIIDTISKLFGLEERCTHFFKENEKNIKITLENIL